MGLNRDQLLLLGAAAILRIAIFVLFPSLQSTLTHRVEISTPVTSFKRLQEGLHLYSNNVSPYDGGVYHQAALFLPVFSLLPNYRTSPIWTNLLYTVTDLLSTIALIQISDCNESRISRSFTSPRKHLQWSSSAIAAAYLFNPFTIATCIAQPTSVFTNCAVLHAVATAVQGNAFNSIFALSLASYFSMYPLLLAPPLAILAYDRTVTSAKCPPRPQKFFTGYAIGLTAAIGGLFVTSFLVMGFSWDFVEATYAPHLLFSDLTPNIGLWWYFFIEMFDSFRDFFLAVFWLHMLSYVGGLTIRIRKQPLFVITTLLGLFSIFKPYPSISDTSLYLALLPLYRHIFPLLRYSFIATAAILSATFLGPAFYHLWIYAGSGNANFFYAITLVWSLSMTILVADSIWAVLREEYEIERPELKDRDIVQI